MLFAIPSLLLPVRYRNRPPLCDIDISVRRQKTIYVHISTAQSPSTRSLEMRKLQ